MPVTPREELDAMISEEVPPKLASKEECIAGERVVLETVYFIH